MKTTNSNTKNSNGLAFKQAVQKHKPLQVVGAINAYSALMAEKIGHRALYLSGGGVAACSLARPDLGISTLHDVLEDAKRITDITSLPLLVDVVTGWGGSFNIARCVREMIRSGVAAIHIEDQVMQKRCGHRPNKAIVSQDEMVDRIKAAIDAKTDNDFVIMARTDALAVEGIQSAIDRALACIEAGADMIFPEAIGSLEQYEQFAQAVKVPILANITEFGQTPLFSKDELAKVGVSLVLYPLSAFRAMSKAAEKVYKHILTDGHQRAVVDDMQSRDELYDYLNYHAYEQKLNELFAQEKE